VYGSSVVKHGNMKIPKHFIGKEVRITWLDPYSARGDLVHAASGKKALAKWIERGVIDDITDGVVRFVESYAYSPGATEPDEGVIGWVPEELIEKCEIMVTSGES